MTLVVTKPEIQVETATTNDADTTFRHPVIDSTVLERRTCAITQKEEAQGLHKQQLHDKIYKESI